MFVYKKLKSSDVSITPFEAHKQFIYDSSSAGNNGITFNTALWTSESKAHYSENNLAGNFQNHRNYFQFDKVFYRDYILDNANLIPDVNYLKQERRLYDKVNILSIPQNLFGSRIYPTTFNLSGSFNGDNTIIEINDDGEGNIYPSNYTLGVDNWPSEKGRVVYIGPVKGFKKKDLNTIPGTGNTLVNRIDSFTLENVYDDSYYLNQIDYNKVTFNGDTPLTFINTGVDGHLRLDHDSKYNFGFNQDFNISFYFKTSETDSLRTETADNNKYYFIAKSDTKTIIPSPGEGQAEILSTFVSGNLQAIDIPAENKYPFKLYYTDDVTNTASLFFERSNGSLTSFVSTSLFYSGSVDEIIHVSAQKNGDDLELWINGVKIITGSDINPSICKDQPPTNQANLYIGSRGNIDSYLNGNLSQIMIWDSALTETQIQNVSESITGTPYIGNIFYDEGFVTISHPSYSDILQQYSGSSQTITLSPTYGDSTNYSLISSSFISTSPLQNSSNIPIPVTFYNQQAKFWFSGDNISFTNFTTIDNGIQDFLWHIFSPDLSSAYISLGNVSLSSINEEVLRFDFMTASTFDVTDTIAQPFTPSGSYNSITNGYLPYGNTTATAYAFLSTSPFEVSESVNILFASNSQVIITSSFIGTDDSSISDTPFGFGSDPVSIGGNNLVNYGGAYQNSTQNGIYIIAENDNTGYYFLGSLAKISNQTSAVGDEDWNKCNFDISTQNVPIGMDSGVSFRTSPNHDIVFLEDFDSTASNKIKLIISGTVDNLELLAGAKGPQACKLYLGLSFDGTEPGLNEFFYYNGAFTGGTFSTEWVSWESTSTFTNFTSGDAISLWVRINDWDSSGNTYQWRITKFEISEPEPDNIFDNKLVLTSSFETKRSSSYDIQINGIDPKANTLVNINALDLGQDSNGNDLGVRVNVYKNVGVNYTLLTSSFYRNDTFYTLNDFNYSHLTSKNEDENLTVYVLATNEDTIGSVEVGISQSFGIRGRYHVIEKSGSNELYLDTSLGANYQNAGYSPVITFGSDSGSIYGINPVSIDSITGNVVTVNDEYLITGSIPATASYFLNQKISASANLNITNDSLVVIENFYLGTGSGIEGQAYSSSLTGDGVPRLRVYSDSTLVNTLTGSDGGLKIENQPLGYFANGSTLGIHLDVVDSTSTVITSSEGEGYSLDDLQITCISSSTTITLENQTVSFDPEITHLMIDSPMGSIGDVNLPFSIGPITASVTYVDDNVVVLGNTENLLFTTESVSAKMVAASSAGFPMIITWTFEGGGDGSIYKFDKGTNPIYNSFFDIIKTRGEVDANEGLTLFITTPGGEVYSSSFIDSASYFAEDLVIPEFTSSEAGTFIVELKTTDSNHNIIPVTWDLGLISTIGENYVIDSPAIFEISGSSVSPSIGGGDVSNWNFDEDTFKIVSTHINTGSFVSSAFDIGIQIISGELITPNNGVTYYIQLDTPLFITASAYVTGGYTENTYFLAQTSQSATSLPTPILEGNFTIKGNTYNIEAVDGNDFIIDEPLILTSSFDVTLNYYTTASNDFTVRFKNTHLIFEHEYQCSVDEEEYNYTQNVSVKKGKSNQSSDLVDCITGSINNSQITLFKPYVTTVGLYDDNYNLLAVGKFAQPIKMSEETDMTFVIRWDS